MKSILYQEYLAYLVGLALSFSPAIHYFDELSIIWKRDLIGKLTHPKEPIPNISIYLPLNAKKWPRPFQSKLRRKKTKALLKRIRKTSKRVAMVKKSTKRDGTTSVFFDTQYDWFFCTSRKIVFPFIFVLEIEIHFIENSKWKAT